MRRVRVPKYGWRVAKALRRYLEKTPVSDPWKNGKNATKEFKSEVTRLLLIEQSKRCAYCGSRLFEEKPHRDHIAPKETYRKWIFWPQNLVLSCFRCNTEAKASYDPVVTEGKSYRTTTFGFVHPYLDDPTEHFTFTPGGFALLIFSKNGSLKGQASIDLFDLSSTERAHQRAKDYLLDDDIQHLHGGPFQELAEAAMEAIARKGLTTKASV